MTSPRTSPSACSSRAILAAVFTVVGYVLALRFVRACRRRDVEMGELLPEELSKDG